MKILEHIDSQPWVRRSEIIMKSERRSSANQDYMP